MKTPYLPLLLAAACLAGSPAVSLAKSKTTPLFNKSVTIRVPADGFISASDRFATVSFVKNPYANPRKPAPTVDVYNYSLKPNEQKWSDKKWRDEISKYYQDPKNKKKYDFKNLRIVGRDKQVTVSVQYTFEDRGKKITYRIYYKQIRVSKERVVEAQFGTEKLKSWNTGVSKRLRAVVDTLKLAKK